MAEVQKNRCDGCTLCCNLLKIPVLQKPANVVCTHCSGGGCSIYESRPAACRKFVCLWYANPGLPPTLQPNRCGVLFEPAGKKPVMMANVDPLRPQAWREGIAWQFIDKCLAGGVAVIVIVGTKKHYLLPKGVQAKQIEEHIKADAIERGFVT